MEIQTDPNAIWTIKDFGNYGDDGGDFSGPNPGKYAMEFENAKNFRKAKAKEMSFAIGSLADGPAPFDMSGGKSGMEAGLGPIQSDAQKNLRLGGDLLGIKAAEEAAQIQADAIRDAASKQAKAARNAAIIGAGVTIGAALI